MGLYNSGFNIFPQLHHLRCYYQKRQNFHHLPLLPAHKLGQNIHGFQEISRILKYILYYSTILIHEISAYREFQSSLNDFSAKNPVLEVQSNIGCLFVKSKQTPPILLFAIFFLFFLLLLPLPPHKKYRSKKIEKCIKLASSY